MKKTEQEILYEQYKYFSDEKLEEIINSNEYDEVAHVVAQKVLSEDRTEYYRGVIKRQQEQQRQAQLEQIKQQEKEVDWLYDYIRQISKNLRFLKNVVITFIVFYIISCLIILFNIIK